MCISPLYFRATRTTFRPLPRSLSGRFLLSRVRGVSAGDVRAQTQSSEDCDAERIAVTHRTPECREREVPVVEV